MRVVLLLVVCLARHQLATAEAGAPVEATAGTTADAAAAGEAEEPVVLLNMHGTVARAGWVLVGPAPAKEGGAAVDAIAPLEDLSGYGDSSVTAIYASHVLTRQSYGTMEFQGHDGADAPTYGGAKSASKPKSSPLEMTLREWHRVLKPGGALLLSVPDLMALAELYLDDALTFAERFFVMRIIFGGQTAPNDFQRVGLDYETAALYLNGTGFCQLKRRTMGFGLFEDDPSDMVFKGWQVSVNIAAIACKPGEPIVVSIPDPADAAAAAATAAAAAEGGGGGGGGEGAAGGQR